METASSRALAAFGATGALDKMVKLPFGEMPAGVALNIAVFDVLTHAADTASATGQTIEDTALVETALEVGHQMIGPDLRAPGIFDPEQPAPVGTTPVVRLLAFARRKVSAKRTQHRARQRHHGQHTSLTGRKCLRVASRLQRVAGRVRDHSRLRMPLACPPDGV
jgi:hypothetical protein